MHTSPRPYRYGTLGAICRPRTNDPVLGAEIERQRCTVSHSEAYFKITLCPNISERLTTNTKHTECDRSDNIHSSSASSLKILVRVSVLYFLLKPHVLPISERPVPSIQARSRSVEVADRVKIIRTLKTGQRVGSLPAPMKHVEHRTTRQGKV